MRFYIDNVHESATSYLKFSKKTKLLHHTGGESAIPYTTKVAIVFALTMKIFKAASILILSLIMIILITFNILPEPEGFPILEYHMVTETPSIDAGRYNVPPSDFNAQLDYLQQNGYNTITMQEYVLAKQGKMPLPDNPIILTFDDGYADNYEYMMPILRAHKMKAVVYVIANEIGKPGYLTIEQLREMQGRGIEIGSHTANHRPLLGLNRKELLHEIGDSKIFLEWSGINEASSLSYPNGLYNEEIINILKETNYKSAVTGDAGLNNFETNPYLLQRVNIPEPYLGIFEFRIRLFKTKLFAKFKINQHRI